MGIIKLNTNTLSVLIAGLYCTEHDVNSMAIPQSLWIEIAEKLESFLPLWDYDKISFEEWVSNCLFIYPTLLLDSEDLEEMKSKALYWERMNGNVMLSVLMDIEAINNV